jgi:hypothetical protein
MKESVRAYPRNGLVPLQRDKTFPTDKYGPKIPLYTTWLPIRGYDWQMATK